MFSEYLTLKERTLCRNRLDGMKQADIFYSTAFVTCLEVRLRHNTSDNMKSYYVKKISA